MHDDQDGENVIREHLGTLERSAGIDSERGRLNVDKTRECAMERAVRVLLHVE